MKFEDDDVPMDDVYPQTSSATVRSLEEFPPQLLVLVLESGDCLFLFLRTDASGTIEAVIERFEPPNSRSVPPGFHLAVDPSSRYLTLGCSEGLFIVYELESFRTMRERYARGEKLRPLKSLRPRHVLGVIHKLEFLYPRAQDQHHIILLLIIVRNNQSRLVTFDWEAGDDLHAVLSAEKAGHRLPPEHQMPLLLIPLTVRSAFFAISAGSIAVCTNVLEGSPVFENFDLGTQEKSDYYHGLDQPLWTAWTRPYRLSRFFADRTKDILYLAREDGVVVFVDIDQDNIGATSLVGEFKCSIATAFCSLYNDTSDILIVGGDSGPGGIWEVR